MRSLKALTALDTRLFYHCQSCCALHVSLASLSRWISRIGDGFFYLLIGAGLAWLEPAKGRDFLTAGLWAFALELPLYLVLKNLIKRDRPSLLAGVNALIQPSDRFSFPSGHAAGAFVFATLIAGFYPAWALAAYTLAMLIGLSRVLLGVHYPSDIVAGVALGVCCTELVLLGSF